MKKKIFCIIAVVVVLAVTLLVPISATTETEKDFYNWSYNIVYSSDSNFDFGLGETVAPLGYYTQYSNAPTDTAERIYFLTLDTAMDGTINNNAYFTTKHWERSVVGEDSMYYKSGYQCIRYKAIQSDSVLNGVLSYDPKNDFSYNSANVYHYIKAVDANNPTPALLTQSTITNVHTDIDTDIYSYQFDTLGMYEILVKVVFFNGDTLEYAFIDNTLNVNVTALSDDETNLWQDGYNNGYDIGYTNGYNKGLKDGLSSKEEWSFMTLLNAIFKAPFTFIDSAFGFEIFGINIATGIRVIFTLSVIALVIGAVVKFLV